MEKKDTATSNSNSQERELQQMQLEERQMHSNGMVWFKGLESHLRTLYQINVFNKRLFKIAFRTYFGEEHQTFRKKMFHNLDQLGLQFERENLHEVNAKTLLKYGELRMKKSEVKEIKETKKRLNEAILHEHDIEKSLKLQSKYVQINTVNALRVNSVVMEDKRYGKENSSSKTALSKSMNERQMQIQEEKVDMAKALDIEQSGIELGTQDPSNRSGNDTDAINADIGPVYDKEPMTNVQLTAECNVSATRQQHAEQPEFNNEGRVE
ncbi:hypothetical protein Tco_1006711 [Tanacetum coccineum]|uniref:Uncharacterized protein n=1 Tax=Tanacetum coccineum TaxID=301880 RepID=A0ABQ5FIN8_9ASTR